MMKNMRSLMALAIMFAVVGWASAAVTTIPMAGGASALTHGTGSATGYANTFISDGTTFSIQADILAVASVIGIGDATVTTTVPTSSYTMAGTQFALTVGAQGVATATVAGTDANADVTSVAHIQSYAGTTGVTAVGDLPTAINGHASIVTEIGQTWMAVTPLLYQQGSISGKPTGKFHAQASADGIATYSGHITQVPATTAPIIATGTGATANIAGSVDGATTIEAQVGDDDAFINGIIRATLPTDHTLDQLSQLNAITAHGFGTEWDTVQGVLIPVPIVETVVPEIAIIAAGSSATIGSASTTTGYVNPANAKSQAGVGNAILVGAQNDGLPLDALTYSTGTIDGVATSSARNSIYVPAVTGANPVAAYTQELKASASKDDQLSADVSVLKALDSAGAISLLATGGVAVPTSQKAGTIADTFGGVERYNPGSATDGSDRTHGEAFISAGQWNSWAADLNGGSIVGRADISGTVSQDGPQTGLGSGAFLQYVKNGPVYANMQLLQDAESDPTTAAHLLRTTQSVTAAVMGPKAHSLGSSGWDGAGVSANFQDLNVAAQVSPLNGLLTGFAPSSISSQIADVGAYLWTDGTNDNQFNGISFSTSYPVFDPAGVGTFTGVEEQYLPSPTQRETSVSLTTTQPSP
jgi:hypothetical protein